MTSSSVGGAWGGGGIKAEAVCRGGLPDVRSGLGFGFGFGNELWPSLARVYALHRAFVKAVVPIVSGGEKELVRAGQRGGGGGIEGGGTTPWCWFVCLWRRLLPSRHCTSRPSVGPNVLWLCQWGPRMTCPV